MRPRIADIITIASRLSDVPEDHIVGPRRWLHLCAVRHPIYVVARQWGYSYPMIGRPFRRDHSTIINSIQAVDRYDSYVDDFDKFCADIERYADELPPFVAETDWQPERTYFVYESERAKQIRKKMAHQHAIERQAKINARISPPEPKPAPEPKPPRDQDLEFAARVTTGMVNGSAGLLAALRAAA